MKKLFVSLILFPLVLSVIAQQRPYYTQYIMNMYLINPAVAGIENYTDVKLSHRMQWVGLQDAPVTTYATLHAPLKKSDYDRETATSFHARGANPRGQAYWEDYTAAAPHQGIGLTILNDITGPLNRFAAYGTYAYHFGIAPKTSLSFGLSAGVTQLSLNASKLNFATSVDPAVNGTGIMNRLKPDISAGVWLYSSNYFAGISVQQIVPQQVSFSDNTVALQNGKLVPHTFVTAGFRTQLNEDVSMLPSVMFRYINPLPLGVDVNVKFQYQDIVWAGASFRNQDGYAIMLGANFNHSLNIGYSYDITTSQLNTVSKGTHEILIGFLLGNKYGDWCPRNLW
ncbi:MAG: type IX secretion system membrane protein PorP/SprF [Sphingobacteriia bacterium]|nr:type IX secretion system membrane protein PorP/SprF [Sphingobacteriia bacterium]